MGIFDFFKQKKKNEEQDIEKQRVKLEELDSWLEGLKKQNKASEERVLSSIKENITEKTKELEEKRKLLDTIDLKNKKEQEKLKIIVLENLSNYSYYVSKLIENLTALKTEDLEETIENINKIYSDFKQKSSSSFEKSTILVGKEIGDIKEAITVLFRELNRVLDENLSIIKKSKLINSLKRKSGEIKELNDLIEEISAEIKSNESKIKDSEAKLESIKNNAEVIKNSKEYKEQQKEKEQAELKKQELEKDIQKLKNLINFKALAKTFHTDSKKMALIKSYEENFGLIFEDDKRKELMLLLDREKQEDAENRVKDIIKQKKEINDIINKKDKIADISGDIELINSSIKEQNSEKQKNKKRIEKLEEDLKVIREQILEELASMNAELIE